MQKLTGGLYRKGLGCPMSSWLQLDISWRQQGARAGLRAEERDGQMCSPLRPLGFMGEGGWEGGSLERGTDGRLSGRLS